MKRTKLKIVSDGTALNTHIQTEDGVSIEGITALEWKIATGSPVAKVTMEIAVVAADIDVGHEDIDAYISYLKKQKSVENSF